MTVSMSIVFSSPSATNRIVIRVLDILVSKVQGGGFLSSIQSTLPKIWEVIVYFSEQVGRVLLGH